MKNVLMVFILQCLFAHHALAQSQDFLRSTGKIYSVVVVIFVIFIGIVIFLYRLDSKITKIEKQINNEQ